MGNLVNRALTFAYKRFDGKVPTPGPLADVDSQLLAKIEAGFAPIGELIAGCGGDRIGLWRVALAFGFVFDVDDFIEGLGSKR